MNKLLFSEGGQPLHLEDLKTLQQGGLELLSALTASIGDFIIDGCKWSHDEKTKTLSWTAGHIAYQGAIYSLEAGSLEGVNFPSSCRYTFRSGQVEPRTFADGQTHSTLLERTASIERKRPQDETSLSIGSMPRLGEDFLRVGRIKYDFQTEVGGVRLESLVETSPNTAILNLVLVPWNFEHLQASYPLIGDFTIEGYPIVYGRAKAYATSRDFGKKGTPYEGEVELEIKAGKVYLRTTGERNMWGHCFYFSIPLAFSKYYTDSFGDFDQDDTTLEN